MRSSLIILIFFMSGLLGSWYGIVPEVLTGNDLSRWALYLLMFLVGISIGADHNALRAVKTHGWKLILVPLVTVAGTFLGNLIIWPLLGNYSLQEVLAVGSGFGYYSLSSILIGQMHSQELGVIALLANISRELLTLLLAPLMAIWFGKLAPVVAGGATSMDTTLPIISTSSGKEFGIIALFHGMVLTILVPFLVTLILSF